MCWVGRNAGPAAAPRARARLAGDCRYGSEGGRLRVLLWVRQWILVAKRGFKGPKGRRQKPLQASKDEENSRDLSNQGQDASSCQMSVDFDERSLAVVIESGYDGELPF